MFQLLALACLLAYCAGNPFASTQHQFVDISRVQQEATVFANDTAGRILGDLMMMVVIMMMVIMIMMMVIMMMMMVVMMMMMRRRRWRRKRIGG
jgi:hypothetical protein